MVNWLFSNSVDFLDLCFKGIEKYRHVEERHSAIKAVLRNMTEAELAAYIGDEETNKNLNDVLDEIKNECNEKRDLAIENEESRPLPNIKWEEIVNAVELLSKEQLECGDYLRYVILTRLNVIDHPPRRRMDYAILKLKKYNPEVDNYYIDGKIVINKYKTAKVYGKYEFNVTEETKRFLEILSAQDPGHPTEIAVIRRSVSQTTCIFNEYLHFRSKYVSPSRPVWQPKKSIDFLGCHRGHFI